MDEYDDIFPQMDRLEEAEPIAREGCRLAKDGKEPWAQHAVAHVMDAQGRVDEGIRWMEGWSSTWEDCNSFMYTHNWWHLSLFHLDRDDIGQIMPLYHKNIWGICKESAQDQVGAISLLWRLELRDIPVDYALWEDIGDYVGESIAHCEDFFLIRDIQLHISENISYHSWTCITYIV